MKFLFILCVLLSVSIHCDSQSQIQSKFVLQSSGILNQDDRTSFQDHLGDVIFVEMFATT